MKLPEDARSTTIVMLVVIAATAVSFWLVVPRPVEAPDQEMERRIRQIEEHVTRLLNQQGRKERP